MFKLIFFLSFLGNKDKCDQCLSKFLDCNANVYLTLPAKVAGEESRVVLRYDDFRKYRQSIDSLYGKKELVVSYICRVIKREEVFNFYEHFFQIYVNGEYQIIFPDSLKAKNSSEDFFSKYVIDFKASENDFLINTKGLDISLYQLTALIWDFKYFTYQTTDGEIRIRKFECF